jgi:hypothetical protein
MEIWTVGYICICTYIYFSFYVINIDDVSLFA